MANAEAIEEEPAKGGKAVLIIGLVLGLLAGGGSFFAAYSGMLPLGDSADAAQEVASEDPVKELPVATYLPLDPVIVTIRASEKYRMLRFSGQLQVKPEFAAELEALKPRIIDVMNTYLNALEAKHFEDPASMIKLRAQLLRRIQIVTGKGRIQDLLIREFVLQ